MKTFIFSFLASLVVFFIATAASSPPNKPGKNKDSVIKLDTAQLQAIQKGLPINITVPADNPTPTPSELVKYILSILGGILTAIILKLLHHWWPNLFPDSDPAKYKSDQ